MRWLRKASTEPLAVSMSSIKLGDRLLIVGCNDVNLAVTLASKAGLTGRTCMVDESEPLSRQAAAAVEREGVLVEGFGAPYSSLPFERAAFDVAVARNTFRHLDGERARQFAAELHRVIRPGGRCIVIEGDVRSGISALLRGRPTHGTSTDAEATLAGAGFRGVRTLAEREGMTFVEGVKPGG